MPSVTHSSPAVRPARPTEAEVYLAELSTTKGERILVRTFTDFEAVVAVGRRYPKDSWRITGYPPATSECDIDATAGPE